MDLTKNERANCTKKTKVDANELLDLAVVMSTAESSGEEKCDMHPEHSKKSDTSPDEESVSDSLDSSRFTVDSNKDSDIASGGVEPKDETKALDVSRSLAFTIDFDDTKVINSKKYNDIVERFQKRHRRGVSLSKLDDKNTSQTSITPTTVRKNSKPPIKKSLQRSSEILEKCDGNNENQSIKLRDKSVFINHGKESNQRHSWSPRSSLNLPIKSEEKQQVQESTIALSGSFKPKSTILQKALQDVKKNKDNNENKRTPQSPLKPNPIICQNIPLEFDKKSEEESVSETGTYTLDGDNYTEEQKAKMCIDNVDVDDLNQTDENEVESDRLFHINPRVQVKQLDFCDTRQANIEPDLKIVELDSPKMQGERRQKNVLEVTYTQGMNGEKPKTSYLEKIKSKVRTIGDKAFNKARSPDKIVATPPATLDIGSFTSVTASGVFSKAIKPQAPKLCRRNSLTQSQVDSSEFVQRTNPYVNDKLFNSYTDYEKARHSEYKLNVFTHPTGCITDAEKEDANNERLAVGLEHAETKNDWIHEWAKSARRNNVANNTNRTKYHAEKHMYASPSVADDFRNNGYSEQFGDSFDRSYQRSTKHSNPYRDHNIYDYEFRPKSANALSNRSAKKSSIVRNSPQMNYRRTLNEFGVGSEFESDDMSSPSEQTVDSGQFGVEVNESNVVPARMKMRPPISPTKIPSPMHSLRRGRSCSVTKDARGSQTDLDDTEMYLHKTAAAISTLQKIHRNNNSPQSPLSPERRPPSTGLISSPSIRNRHHKPHPSNCPIDQSAYTAIRLQQLHKRNNSLDGLEYKPKLFSTCTNSEMSHSYEPDQLGSAINSKPHTRHNSYEDKTSTSAYLVNLAQFRSTAVAPVHKSIEQTFSPQILMRNSIASKYQPVIGTNNRIKSNIGIVSGSSPQQSHIKRSSSFSTKQFGSGGRDASVSATLQMTTKSLTPKMTPKIYRGGIIQKSASSASFKKMTSSYDDGDFYLNDEDDLNPNHLCTSDSDLSDTTDNDKGPITNTRYNKAFLIRMEQNKQKASGTPQTKQGVAACPNTPELPRRDNTSRIRSSLRDRASMPRDSSLNRMKQDIPSLNISKKVLTTKEAKDHPKQKIQPKYLDISKYKPGQGNTFLKRDESKSTLINKDLKRSTSAFVGLSKADAGRSSMRSVKSAGSSKPSTPAANKEAELAMWRRRASYDPMKAAAEGKRKQDEARKSQQSSKYSESSVVLRSQSFHNGVGQTNIERDDPSDEIKHRWSLIGSTESSDDEFI